MSTAVVNLQETAELQKIEQVLINGDLSVLTPLQRTGYYKKVCDSLGLNVLTKPFDYITLNGRLTLYARKDATDQLRSLKKVSITISSRELIEDVYVVTARARLGDREDESTGAVNVAGLKGDARANAYMKAETKAKRRVTLSICGLGLLDETEVADIPQTEKRVIVADQPDPDEGVKKDVGYLVPFGKFAKRSLEEIDLNELRNYVVYLEEKAAKDNKPLAGRAAEFVERATAHIMAFENFEEEVNG